MDRSPVPRAVAGRAERPGWDEWNPLAGDSDVLCVERTASDPAPHLHEGLQLSLVQRPTASTGARGQLHPALPRTLLAVNALELHRDGPLADAEGDGWFVRELHVGPAVLADVVAAQGSADTHAEPVAAARRPWFPTRVVSDAALSAAFNGLYDDMRADRGAPATRPAAAPGGAHALERESRLLQYLGALVARHAGRPAAQAPLGRGSHGVRRAREYLHAHLKEHVALADLAGVAGVNKFYLIRAFEREVGLPPHAYHTHLRLARARHLIARGEALSDVAFDAGFADQSHLTRRFKALFGVTPGEYAKRRGRVGEGAERDAGVDHAPPAVARGPAVAS